MNVTAHQEKEKNEKNGEKWQEKRMKKEKTGDRFQRACMLLFCDCLGAARRKNNLCKGSARSN